MNTANPITEINHNNLPQAVNYLITQFSTQLTEIKDLLTHSSRGAAIEKPITVKEAADYLSTTPGNIYVLISQKKLPHYKQGGKLFFYESELMNYIKQGRKKTQAEIDAEARKHRK